MNCKKRAQKTLDKISPGQNKPRTILQLWTRKYEEDQNWDNLSNFDTFNAYSYFDMLCPASGRQSTLHIRNQGVFDAFTYNPGGASGQCLGMSQLNNGRMPVHRQPITVLTKTNVDQLIIFAINVWFETVVEVCDQVTDQVYSRNLLGTTWLHTYGCEWLHLHIFLSFDF